MGFSEITMNDDMHRSQTLSRSRSVSASTQAWLCCPQGFLVLNSTIQARVKSRTMTTVPASYSIVQSYKCD